MLPRARSVGESSRRNAGRTGFETQTLNTKVSGSSNNTKQVGCALSVAETLKQCASSKYKIQKCTIVANVVVCAKTLTVWINHEVIDRSELSGSHNQGQEEVDLHLFPRLPHLIYADS